MFLLGLVLLRYSGNSGDKLNILLNFVSNCLSQIFPTTLASLFLKLLAESSLTMRKKYDRTYLSENSTMEDTQSPDPITSTRSSGLRYRRSRPPGHSKLSGILSRPQARREGTEQVELNEILSSDPGSNPTTSSNDIRVDLVNDMSWSFVKKLRSKKLANLNFDFTNKVLDAVLSLLIIEERYLIAYPNQHISELEKIKEWPWMIVCFLN